MKSIVILTDSIHKIGGIESLIYIKANYWTTIKKYKVTIITTEQKGKKSLFKMDKNIPLVDLSINYDRTSSYFGPRNFLKIVKNFFQLQKHINTIQPDILIIANHIPVTFFFPLLKTRAKIIKEFHFSKFYISKAKKSFFKKYEAYLESKLDYSVVLSEEERQFYNTGNVVVIPNPVLNISNDLKLGHRANIAIAAGRLAPVKRFDILIDIWEKFVQINPNTTWKLQIYGDGESNYMEELRQKIKNKKLVEHIQLMGSVTNMQEIMQNVGLYLMTSGQECFPMVLLEAQAAGLPIISFDCPTGPRNIITNNNNGILVENNNQTDFVTQLTKLTSNEKARTTLAKNGLVNVQKYTLEKIMEIWDHEIINN